MYNAMVHHEQKVSNNLYNIDFIMKNCFTEWAKKQELYHIYKHVIFVPKLNVVRLQQRQI